MKEYVIFGASELGKIAYHDLKDDYNITAFIDNNHKIINTIYNGLPILNPNILYENDYHILICSSYKTEIIEQLINMGIKKFYVYETNINRKVITKYDYSDKKNFSVLDNKIAIVIENHSGSNTLALTKYLKKVEPENYEIVILYSYDKDTNYYYDLLTSRMIIHTHDSTFNKKQINIQLWHGFPIKGVSYMNKSQAVNKEFNHIQWSKLNKIASYSQVYTTLINACYGLNVNKYIITGMPRNDLLYHSNGKEKLSMLIGKDIKNKNVILYMPTFRETEYGYEDGGGIDFDLFNIKGFKETDFDNYMNTNDTIFIVKVHPMHTDLAKQYLLNREMKNVYIIDDASLVKQQLDLYEIISGSEILITDYSSVYFDYLLLNKPIIFIPTDLNKYRENRGFLLEPYEFWTPGPKCYTYEDLKREINKSLNNQSYYLKERELICNIIHYYKDSNSSKRIWQLIMNEMNMFNKRGK